ncbi:hypothetical protein, partial [Faecalispora jeddahensis]|uniref:hypothetical protein n=1 Tax=Faecalispora jeddahensis TaxID=1414721 RepID=UPI0028B1CEDC
LFEPVALHLTIRLAKKGRACPGTRGRPVPAKFKYERSTEKILLCPQFNKSFDFNLRREVIITQIPFIPKSFPAKPSRFSD